MKPMEINSEMFVEKIADFRTYPDKWEFKGDKPVLVDFHAPWCGYCKALSPMLDQLSSEYEGKIDIYKVDVDHEPDLESKFNIRTIPTLLFAVAGKHPELMLGTLTKVQLKALIEEKLLE